MKIYFEDGKLKDVTTEIPHDINLELDAKYGFSFCDMVLWKLKQTNNRAVVYTNQITALSNEYAWNEELKIPEIYIRNKDGVFTCIDNLTNKVLREAHNIMKMYIAGSFNGK